MTIKRIINIFCIGACIGLLTYFSIYTFSVALYTIPTFDGGMNVQVPINMLKYGKYATNYNGLFIFDHKIQTGFPVLFLTYVMFGLFGVGSTQAILVNSIFLISLFIIANLYLWFRFHKAWINVILSTIFLFLPNLAEFGFGLFGEIPTLTLWFVFLYFYYLLYKTKNIRYGIFAGVFFGLAYLSKTVILVTFPFIILFGLFDILITKELKWKHYITVGLSAISMVFLFEVYKLSQFNFNLIEYFDWWRYELNQIGNESGVSDTEHVSIFDKFSIHLNIFNQYFNFKPNTLYYLIVFNAIIPIKSLINFFKKSKIQYTDLIIWTSFMSYFGWWLIITSTHMTWERRIYNGYIFLVISSVLSLSLYADFFQFLFKKFSFKHTLAFAYTLTIVYSLYHPFVSFQKDHFIKEYNEYDTRAKAIFEMGETVSSLPNDAKIYGFGWWQAPVVAFLSHRELLDLNQSILSDFQNSYLLIDEYAYSLAGVELEQVLENYELEQVANYGNNFLYKIIKFNVPSFTNEQIASANKAIDFSIDQGQHTRGVHSYELDSSTCWVQSQSFYLLKSQNEKSLNVRFYVPDLNLYKYKEANFYIYINNKLLKTQLIDQNGLYEIKVPLSKDEQSQLLMVKLVFNNLIVPKNDPRQLSFIIKTMELK